MTFINMEEGSKMETLETLEAERAIKRAKMVEDAAKTGDDQKIADAIEAVYWMSSIHNHESVAMLETYSKAIKSPQILFDLIISIYVSDGYNFPKRLIQMAKRLSKQIPGEKRLQGLPDGDTITIWRGTYIANPQCGNVLKTNISWTTSKATAAWFANRITNPGTATGKGCVWEATIQRDKIIAFTDDRGEAEIIQHMNARNPHIINLTSAELEALAQEAIREREDKKR